MDLLKAFHNPSAKVGSSVFDLGCRRVYSSKCGQLVPALVLDTVPGDQFEISMQALMRSNTMDTAAFVRGKFNYDFFFVPYSQVWHRFLEFVGQHTDLHTALFTGRNPVSTPNIRLADLIFLLGDILIADYAHNQDIVNDLGDLGSAVNETGDNIHLGSSWVYDSVKLLNQLGYGDFSGIFDFIDQDNLSDVNAHTGNYAKWVGDLCGDGTSSNPNIYINPFRLCAYQHIWYDIYRNKYFDVPTPNRSYEGSFNLDDVDCSSIGNAHMSVSSDPIRFLRMTMLHYCQWKKDIYTSLMPSQQYGVVSSVDFLSGSVVNGSGSSMFGNRVLSSNAGNIVASSAVANGSAPSAYYDSSAFIKGSFDVLSLRRAEAMQKWKESALRAGNMANDNQRAHFGVDPYYYEHNEVHFLGSFDGTFQVNPIVASSAAASGLNNNKVGDLAATGTSVISDGNTIQFDCRDYGIIMCLSRFVPETEYSAVGIEKSNTRFEAFDYYTPEFNSLGLQAVPLLEQENSHVLNDTQGKNFVLGYAPRDYDYKQMQDKVYGQFINKLQNASSRQFGVFSNWVAPRCEVLYSVVQGVPNGRSLSSFYVDPRIFDQIFLINADYPDEDDQFLHQCYFDVKAIRKMPVLGLPEF